MRRILWLLSRRRCGCGRRSRLLAAAAAATESGAAAAASAVVVHAARRLRCKAHPLAERSEAPLVDNNNFAMATCSNCGTPLGDDRRKSQCGLCKDQRVPEPAVYCGKKCAQAHWKKEHKAWHEERAALLDRDSGVGIWLELRGDLAGASDRVGVLVAQNDSLAREIELLEADPSALDRAIREEMDLALPGEVVFRFVPALDPALASPTNE